MDVERDRNQGLSVQAYLDRIGFKGVLDGSLATLGELQYCHLHTIPYENLDIIRGVPLSLDIPAIYDKVVVRGRGGFCFELNALFAWLLTEAGYEIRQFLARFWRDEPNPPPMRRHQVLQVTFDGVPYLCDVGVGGVVPRRPLPIVNGREVRQGDEIYKLEKDNVYGWMLKELKSDGWRAIYSFTEEPQYAKDYVMPSYWCEHAPDSVFRNKTIVAIRTEHGRNTLADREFRIFSNEEVRTFTADSEQAYRDALQTYFGIKWED